MITIADNDKYNLRVDPTANRAFLKIHGFWRNKDEVANYLSDWDDAIEKLSKGFTLLTDATDMAIHPGDVRELHSKAQDKINDAGVKKVAELHQEGVAEMQLKGVAKESGMPKKDFTDVDEAIKWLDQ